jgi:hypothetical protein
MARGFGAKAIFLESEGAVFRAAQRVRKLPTDAC